ncbi:unnamed protein product [Cunninghamella echinulata]
MYVEILFKFTSQLTFILYILSFIASQKNCKKNNANIDIIYELLTAQIHKKHAQIRYSCLQLYEELFQRSNYFRILVTNDFPDFVQLSVGIRSYELPPPAPVAKKLRQYAIALIKNWYQHFGDHYRPLGIGYDYLAHNGFIRNDNQTLQSIHYNDRVRSDKEARMKVIEERRFEQIKVELGDQLELLHETIKNMESCFEILIPKNTNNTSTMDFESLLRGERQPIIDTSVDPEGYKDAIISHGLGSNRYSITINMSTDNPLEDQVHESDENKILYDQLREGYKLLETKQEKQVNRWMKSLIRMEHIDKKEKESIMKNLINIKGDMAEVIRKVKLLGIEIPFDHRQSNNNNDQDYDDEDDEYLDEIFEDIELPDISQEEPSTSKDHAHISNALLPPSQRMFPLSFEPHMAEDVTYNGPQIQDFSLNKNNGLSDNDNQKLNKGKEKEKQKDTHLREELLKKAPVVEWGDDLYYWDKKNVQFNSSGIEFSHRFMGSGEGTNEMPEHLLEDLRKRAIYYKSEVPKNIKACRHPLKQGGLCPRRDLVTCPFHGKIIPRDEYGQPTTVINNESSSTASSSSYINNDNNQIVKESTPPINDYWQEIEGDVMKQLGKDKIEPNKKGRRKNNASSKKKSALIDIRKKPDTPYTRLNKKIESKESRLMVEEALEYERSIKSRDRKVSTWRQ